MNIDYQKVLESVSPVADEMARLDIDSVKVALAGPNGQSAITVVVSCEDKAQPVSDMMDLLDKTYDESVNLDEIMERMKEIMLDVAAKGEQARKDAEATNVLNFYSYLRK